MEQSRAAAPTLDWVAVPSHVAEGPAEVRHKDGWLVCFVPADSYAKLIAAAPELHSALTELLERYTQLVNCGDCGNWNPETEAEVKAARAALAKAAS